MKSFCQVKLLNVSAEIVDTSVVETGLEWLSSKQRLLGDFQEDGGRPHFSVKGPREYQCSLTAFVTIAFLECSSRTTLDLGPKISSGIRYLINCVSLPDPCMSTFELAISGYALCLANSSTHSQLALRLLWHCAQVNDSNYIVDWIAISSSRAAAIETAAYALLGFLCNNDLSYATSIARWLNSQRSLGGGFVSTQDTVIALEALAAYAERTFQNIKRPVTVIITSVSDSHVSSSYRIYNNSLLPVAFPVTKFTQNRFEVSYSFLYLLTGCKQFDCPRYCNRFREWNNAGWSQISLFLG
jgi:hypothetical protein